MILSLRNRHLAIHVTLDSCPLGPERGNQCQRKAGKQREWKLRLGPVFALRWHEKAQNCFDDARWWWNYDMVQILYDARHYRGELLPYLKTPLRHHLLCVGLIPSSLCTQGTLYLHLFMQLSWHIKCYPSIHPSIHVVCLSWAGHCAKYSSHTGGSFTYFFH